MRSHSQVSRSDNIVDEDERAELGRRLGDLIVKLFEIIADLDDRTTQETIDSWVSGYVAERIIQDSD